MTEETKEWEEASVDDVAVTKKGFWEAQSLGLILLLFSVALFASLGLLIYLRETEESLSPLAFKGRNAFLTAGTSALLLFSFLNLVAGVKNKVGLQNLGAFVVLLCFMGVAFYGFLAYTVYTSPPNGALFKRGNQLAGTVKKVNQDLGPQDNDGVVLTEVNYFRNIIRYFYEIAPGVVLDGERIKENLRKDVCSGFAYHFQHQLVGSVKFLYRARGVIKTSVSFSAKDCPPDSGRQGTELGS